MKRLVLLTLTAATLVATTGNAQATEVGNSRTFGLGFQIGEPTAITAKVFVGGGNAFDFGIGMGGWCTDANNHNYSCRGWNANLSLHADYLYQENIINMVNRLDWYAGLGGHAIFWGHESAESDHGIALIARVPVGLAVTFRRPSFLELYLEIVPALVVFPPLWFTIELGLGARAYF